MACSVCLHICCCLRLDSYVHVLHVLDASRSLRFHRLLQHAADIWKVQRNACKMRRQRHHCTPNVDSSIIDMHHQPGRQLEHGHCSQDSNVLIVAGSLLVTVKPGRLPRIPDRTFQKGVSQCRFAWVILPG
jgi:hypothetical protein